MSDKSSSPRRFVEAISRSGISIYDPIEIGDPNLWIPSPELEVLLDEGLRGMSLSNLPLRTRSKVVKEQICRVLGYSVPRTFKKTQPRFTGQYFDAYVQKSNNLQVWNEELSPTRRYVLIRVSNADIIQSVKVVTGDTLARLDTTGTLTQKYQARLVQGDMITELVSTQDTENVLPLLTENVNLSLSQLSPIKPPSAGLILPIGEVYSRLVLLVGQDFTDAGRDQERNRGTELHRLVCHALGYKDYQDDGRFPDVRNQLLEVKLQTSPTIDLGLVRPDSEEPLDISQLGGRQIRHCDVRYAVYSAESDGNRVYLNRFYLTCGRDFFSRFPQFQGRILNRKLQIPLPRHFFDR